MQLHQFSKKARTAVGELGGAQLVDQCSLAAFALVQSEHRLGQLLPVGTKRTHDTDKLGTGIHHQLVQLAVRI